MKYAGETPSSDAAIWHILVWRPWPISVPPCDTKTVPSVYTCTSALAWFMNLAVKDMPNLTGIIDRPRFLHRLALLKSSTARRRLANSDFSLTSAHMSRIWQSSRTCV